uniref:Uncharacterized protein n=1 Tax=Glossina brevipalpis TaxID=37001 RepID=A0A1A9X5B8_9MUSC
MHISYTIYADGTYQPITNYSMPVYTTCVVDVMFNLSSKINKISSISPGLSVGNSYYFNRCQFITISRNNI